MSCWLPRAVRCLLIFSLTSLSSWPSAAAVLPLSTEYNTSLRLAVVVSTDVEGFQNSVDVKSSSLGSLSVVPIPPFGQYVELELDSLSYSGDPISVSATFGLFDTPVTFAINEIAYSSLPQTIPYNADYWYSPGLIGAAQGTLSVGTETVPISLAVEECCFSSPVEIAPFELSRVGLNYTTSSHNVSMPLISGSRVVSGTTFHMSTYLLFDSLVFVPEPDQLVLSVLALVLLLVSREARYKSRSRNPET